MKTSTITSSDFMKQNKMKGVGNMALIFFVILMNWNKNGNVNNKITKTTFCRVRQIQKEDRTYQMFKSPCISHLTSCHMHTA